jgi:hypothetical protein|tara:strand:+ start:1298 stop:1483 length:186 start_codon:yes stop_codon:yes gene_type:complete
MAEPPISTGATQVRVTWDSPLMPYTPVGASGARILVNAIDIDAAPSPVFTSASVLVAFTVK